MALGVGPNPNRKLQELKDAAAKARLPYDKDVWLNIAFYNNEQYVQWSDDVSSIQKIPRKSGFENTPRPVANKIMHFVAQEHAMALQTRPTADVLPATDNPLDMSDSQVALAYLRYVCEPQIADFDAQLADATLWALVGAEAFLKWTWNPRTKQADIAAISPLDIYPDPYAKSFSKCRYVIHSQFMDVEQVYDIYGIEVPKSDMDRADPTKAALLREMGQAPILEGAVVNEIWMKPNRRHPNGLFAVWTGKQQLVAQTDLPYAHRRLPFTQIGSIPRPGSLHYTCAVKYLRQPQMELNRYHAQKIQGREAFVNYKWWLDSALDLEDDPDDSPRQILRGNSENGAIEPKIITPPPLPDNGDGIWISQEMMNVVGLHEVSQAQVPGRVEAAKAIELLKESDDSRLAELLRTTTTAISEGFYQILMLAKQFESEEKMVQSYTPDGVFEVQHFRAEALNPGLRVQITMGTGLARTRAARQDQLMTLWQNQIIRDPETLARLLDVPVATIAPERVYDTRLAHNENLEMAKGTAITPNSWDDHELHLREHNNYRKTAAFLTAAADVKGKFEFHCQAHDKLELQQLQKDAMKQQVIQSAMAPPGADPGAAPGGPPTPGPQAPAPPTPVGAQAAAPSDDQ